MIRTTILGQWGTNAIEGGIQINIKPEPNQEIYYHIPFTHDALKDLVKEAAEQLSEEHKRELASLFNGGIFLPGQDFQQGPQG